MPETLRSGLKKPSDGQQNAGEDYNGNMDILDGIPRYKLTLGEVMLQWAGGYIASDGKAYNADASATTTSWVIGFLEAAGATNDERYFRRGGVAPGGYAIGLVGRPLYLGTAGDGMLTENEPPISRNCGVSVDIVSLLINITW